MQTHHARQIRSHLEAMCQLMASHRQVWEAEKARTGDNGAAYAAARRNWHSMMGHWTALHGLLPDWTALEKGESQAIDGYLAFVEQDVPAFRAGYVKERIYRRLRRLPLSPAQRARLLDHALALVSHPDYRREIGELGVLAARLCDGSFLVKVASRFRGPGDPRIQVKAARMLLQICALRQDLRASMPVRTAELEDMMRAAQAHAWNRVKAFMAQRGTPVD